MYDRETIALQRSCEAVLIPAGNRVLIPEGTEVTIAQAMGGSFTVYVGGNLVRISGKDADALGRDPIEPPALPDNASTADIEHLVWEQLKTCYDPEIPINIVDLGLVYRCEIVHDEGEGQSRAEIDMTLTAPGCGMGGILIQDVKEKVELVPGIREARVELVFDPPWNQEMMSDEARLQTGMF